MERLFFLVPTLEATSNIIQDLKNNAVSENNIHVMGDMSNKLKIANIPEANVLHTTHVLPAIKRGALLGLALAVLLCVVLYFALPPTIKLSILMVIGILLFGVVFGIWASGLVGVAFKDPTVEKYQNYAKSGHFLLMVDVLPDKENLVKEIVGRYPDVSLAQIDPNTGD